MSFTNILSSLAISYLSHLHMYISKAVRQILGHPDMDYEIGSHICFTTFVSIATIPFNLANSYIKHASNYSPHSSLAETRSIWFPYLN